MFIVIKLSIWRWVLSACVFFVFSTACIAQNQEKRDRPIAGTATAFSEQSNFMSPTGFARWKHFEQTQEWDPEVVKEVIASSPADGGFDWYNFLLRLEVQVKEHPYARQFVLSWHIDTIGPDWQDDYLLTHIYERDWGIIYPTPDFGLNGVSVNKSGLTDELIPLLIAKWREFNEYRWKNLDPRTDYKKWKAEDPDKKLFQWWREQTR
jgi:hypothetical protein